ncbi:MAG: monooxygenase [Paenibacillus sp.]|jgi:2-polyprenyl-6-methoxyphenol hydroxylase-like FAD-dependent oxidoreductase|nr:monooxygenase [Paenibacillus sp.]
MSKPEFIIIGGGIAGLSAAVALLQKGFKVEVYEGAPVLKAAGAGLGVGANALKAMKLLGLGEQLLEKGKVLAGAKILNEQGDLITRTDSIRISSLFGTDNITIHRAELLTVLAGALPREAIKTDKKCVEFTERPGGGVSVRFHDGTIAEADGLIAADGIHSVIRRKVVPAAVPRYSGYTCWRSVVSGTPAGYDDSVFTETWGSLGRFGIMPLSNNQIYWFACVNAPARDPRFAEFGVRELGQQFRGYHAPIGELLAKTEDAALLHNDIYDLKPLKRFAYGSTVLIGDAAHATTPNLGQGAGQAMEDAVFLANCLAVESGIPEAFRRFEQLRIPRTRKIVNTSWTIGKIAQLDSKLLCKARNSLFRLVPARANERQLRFLLDIHFDEIGS